MNTHAAISWYTRPTGKGETSGPGRGVLTVPLSLKFFLSGGKLFKGRGIVQSSNFSKKEGIRTRVEENEDYINSKLTNGGSLSINDTHLDN